jgi:cell division septal protein FtsQ
VYRREKVKRRLFRLLLAAGIPLFLLLVAAIAGFAGGTFGSQWLKEKVTQASVFRLADMTVGGNRVLSEGEVVEAAGVTMGESILAMDLEGIRSRLLTHPLVRSAAVARRLPSGVIIDIEERTPAALVRADGEQVVDRDGYAVHVPEGLETQWLPCFEGVEMEGRRVTERGLLDLSDGMDLIHAISSFGFPPLGRIACIDLSDRNDAVLLPAGDGPLVHLGREKTTERLRRWKLVAPDLASQWEAVEYIDLRAEGQVVAKPQVLSDAEGRPGGGEG